MTWNVIIEDNGKIKPYNVFNNRLFSEGVIELITNIEYKDMSRDELSEIIKRKAQWQFWSRCEYEVLILSWPPYKDEEGYKMDVYEQLRYNWDRFIDYIIRCRDDEENE